MFNLSALCNVHVISLSPPSNGIHFPFSFNNSKYVQDVSTRVHAKILQIVYKITNCEVGICVCLGCLTGENSMCARLGSLIRFKKTKQARRRKHVTNHKTITRIFARAQRIHENNVADKCNAEFCVVFS